MRLMIVTESFLPRVDGVSRSVSALTRHCRERGHDAIVVAPGHGPGEVDGFPVVRVMGLPALYPGLVLAPLAPGLRGLIDRFAPDVVHLASPAVLGAAAVRAAVRSHVPIVAHFQTDLGAYARHYRGGAAVEPVARRWMRRLHNRCDATYAPTERTADMLRGHRIERVRVSGRGVDTALFRPGRPGAATAATRWPPGGSRVLCVARLAPEKGLLALVELGHRNPDLSILLVGAGPQAEELRRHAPPNMRLTGLLEGDELADVYAAAEIFAFPSTTETFGQVVQEAMASGLAVAAMRAGGVAEIVEHNVTGVLAEPSDRGLSREGPLDIRGFEGAVRTLVADPDRRAALGQAAAARMQTKSWASVLDALMDDYARLSPSRSRSARTSAAAVGTAEGRAAAFFDVDRTILHGSSFLALAGPCARAGLLSRRAMVRAGLHQIRFAAAGAPSERSIARRAARGVPVLRGLDAARLRAVGLAAMPTHLAPRIFPAARALIREHQAGGEPVFLISSAPEEIVAGVAQLVGADGFVGSIAEVVDGEYTGRITRLCQGQDKVKAMRDLAARHGLDLTRSTAYGDSAGDAAMLASAGRAVCVNPDRVLSRVARLRCWEVRRFRLQPRELGHRDRLAAEGVTVAS